MAKTDTYTAENSQEHAFLLTAMHTYAMHHPRELVEKSYHEIPSQRGVYKMRIETLTSTYHLGDSTLQHVTGELSYLAFTGRNRKVRLKAARKLEEITSIKLNPLKVNGEA